MTCVFTPAGGVLREVARILQSIATKSVPPSESSPPVHRAGASTTSPSSAQATLGSRGSFRLDNAGAMLRESTAFGRICGGGTDPGRNPATIRAAATRLPSLPKPTHPTVAASARAERLDNSGGMLRLRVRFRRAARCCGAGRPCVARPAGESSTWNRHGWGPAHMSPRPVRRADRPERTRSGASGRGYLKRSIWPGWLLDELAGVHDPGWVEALLDRQQRLDAELADLGLHVGSVVAADRMVMGDRPPGGDDRVAGGGLELPPLLDLGAGTGAGSGT